MKVNRLEVISELILQYDVDKQETLLKLLLERGFNVTQATVSRDIKRLKLVKVLGENGIYKYTKPSAGSDNGENGFLADAVDNVDYAMNTVVLKCRAGTAQAACAALDSMKNSDIVGTIAGDDTIFVLMRTENEAELLCKKFTKELCNGNNENSVSEKQ